MEGTAVEELLFFDTFSHDASEEINLDLVQFPKPVIISEIRIIPLGARVEADFPGGVRLGATNPSQFHIEFFVNDLSKPGASTFESLGALEYRETSDIQFQCEQKKIPTDGLVLRGWYTTITLAVYGSLSKGIPPPPPDPRAGDISTSAATAEWVQSQQAAMYMDPGYNYPPPDFPAAAPELPYAEPWPSAPPPAAAPLGHNGPYDPSGKDYSSQQNWEPPPDDVKPWKEDLVKSASPIRTGSSGGDSAGKSRHRSDYWDERDDRKDRRRRDDDIKRSRDSSSKDGDRRRDRSPAWRDSEPRSRSQKGLREDSWDREREKSPHSESGSYRRRPKSPPSRSPKRPFTPTDRFWSPDRRDYRSPTGRYGDERRRSSPPPLRPASPAKPRSSDQLRVEIYAGSPQTPLQSPAGPGKAAIDERSLDEEQFEPILSDEEIVDEPESQFPDMDYDVPDDLEEVVKPFNPFSYLVQPLEHFIDPSLTQCESLKGRPNPDAVQQLEELLKTPLEVKMDWILAAEQLPSLLPLALASPTAVSSFRSNVLKWVEFGLNMDEALGHAVPGAKLRHIKAGIRIAESLSHCNLNEDLISGKVHERLLKLFQGEYMALSIRLLIIQAIDTTVLDRQVMESFVNDDWELEVNGTAYQHVLRLLTNKLPVRIKFALTSLIQKVHVVEILTRLHELTMLLTEGKELDDKNIILCLKAINQFYVHAGTLLSQPRRFLPIQSQFEINMDPKIAYLFLYRYFRRYGLLECILVFLTNRTSSQTIFASSCDLLRNICDRHDGLLFLASSPTVTSSILKALQSSDEFNDHSANYHLFMDLPYRLRIINSLDKLLGSNDEGEVFTTLHELYCLTLSTMGKFHIAYVLSLEENLQILLKFVDKFGKKSAVYGYVCDLAAITVKYSNKIDYLRPISKVLLEIGASDPQSKLAETSGWIRPIDVIAEDVSALCEVLKNQIDMEMSGSIPGEVIAAVRILQKLCVPPLSDLPNDIDCHDVEFKELRYKYNALQLYSLEGVTHITGILTKIIEYYEQPFTHSASLLGYQGVNVVSFIEPAIVLLRVMLSHLIEARGSDYKDLTHVNVLVEIYALMQAVPNNAEAHINGQRICRHIVETLLTYTLPSTQPDVSGKSLWSLMLSDVLKFIMKAPYCFIPGFSLLSELLPLPLPIQTRSSPAPEEILAMRSTRQFWSAHVHPLAGALHDLVAALAGGSFAPLLQLVRRVAVQLADLAAPTALILARAVIDPLLVTIARPDGGWELPVSPHAARLLHFLACLVPHPAFKVAVLSLITPGANARTDERLLTLVDALITVLRTPGSSPSHAQAQEYVILLIQTLLDPDVSLIPIGANGAGLANALPARDLLSTMVSALLDHAGTLDNPLQTLLSSLKPLIMLTDHDYGFYHLRVSLDTRPDAVYSVLLRLSNELNRDNTDALNALHGTLALLREMVLDAPTPMRTLTMTAAELSQLVRWESNAEESHHPLLRIHSSLKEWSENDDTLSNLCESAGDLVKLLTNCDVNDVTNLPKEEEHTLPAAMPLMDQFANRPVVVTGDPELKSLSSAYWLSLPPLEDADQDIDQVSCDLIELSRSLLPDLHLSQEVLRICRLKPPEDDEEGKKQEPSKYQLSGIRSRRPFVAPMRGRGGRPAPQRGDLFRSRPPNTSRPPSLHVDDFVALETCGQQPTGPTGYNKVSVRNVKEVIATRSRGRGRVFGAAPYPRRDSPRSGTRGRGLWAHDDLRQQPSSRLRTWQTEDLRRIHPFPR